MKRNWDIIRNIMLWLESGSPNGAPDGIDDKEFMYHVKLLMDKNLITDCEVQRFINGGELLLGCPRLTFDGHEFLDNIRHDNPWAKTKSWLAKFSGDVSFSVVSELAAKATKTFIMSVID